MSAYEQLHGHFRRIGHLEHVYRIAEWDEAAMMPTGGGEARGEGLAALDVTIHELRTDARIADWLEEAGGANDLTDWQRANVREIARAYGHATCLPGAFVERRSLVMSRTEQAWRQYRSENNWAAMAPLLGDVVATVQEEAALRAESTGLAPYDAMLALYEPGMDTETVDSLFAELKSFLPGFIDRVTASRDPGVTPTGPFLIDRQRELGLRMMRSLGFDFEHGRLDVSHHPFCGGVPDDVRITTRYDEADFAPALMAVLHETGHALYEQGLPAAWRGQPVGEARSAGVHESQSLLMEMQACRTREFLGYAAPHIREIFGIADDAETFSADNLHRVCTRVTPGLIRVDADEVTYPLHVILRYEIEQELIGGTLAVADLPDAWAAKMQAYLGLDTHGNYADGCLQDVHWSAGLFGYFPTYSLGAMAAAQLFATAEAADPSIKPEIARGNFVPLVAWLRTHVHERGSLLETPALLEAATGSPLVVDPFLTHLERRYGSD